MSGSRDPLRVYLEHERRMARRAKIEAVLAWTFMLATIVLVVAMLILILGYASLTFAPDAYAREPVVSGEARPVEWPCLAEGWTEGDVFGPGEADVVPSAEPCPTPWGPPGVKAVTPVMTLPPTDTAP